MFTSTSCPFCFNPIPSCQCAFTGSAHEDNRLRREVVLQNLHLLSESQLNHIIRLQNEFQISYGDARRQEIQMQLASAHEMGDDHDKK